MYDSNILEDNDPSRELLRTLPITCAAHDESVKKHSACGKFVMIAREWRSAKYSCINKKKSFLDFYVTIIRATTS